MTIGQHPLMQDTGNQGPATLLPIEHDVPAMLMTAQARTDVITGSAQEGISGKHLTAGFNFVKVVGCLDCAPFAYGVIRDIQKVGLGTTRESTVGHFRAPGTGRTRLSGQREFESLTDTSKDIPLGNTAGITFVNRAAKRDQLRFV